jgi:hypothetical protein
MTVRAEAAVLTCPSCGAKPNKPCTKAAPNGRRPITWLHLARELKADELAPEWLEDIAVKLDIELKEREA